MALPDADGFLRRILAAVGGYALSDRLLGAGIGGALATASMSAPRLFGFGFPFGTLIVNVVGSFLMGLLAGYFAFRPGHRASTCGCS